MAKEQDELLKDKLLKMGLQDQSAIFIINKGEKFNGHPEILAEKLGIDVNLAEMALADLKAHKERQNSLEFERFKELVKENPDTSVNEIALLNEIDEHVVSAYFNSSKTNDLTEFQRVIIKEKHNDGFSIPEIAEELDTSPESIREYVEKNCFTFNGTEGLRILEIIHKNFEKQPVMKLKEMIINKNVKLQEKICWDLQETNPKEYEEVKQYFEKFEETQNFFNKNDTLSIEDKICIRSSSLEGIEQLSIRLNRVERVIQKFILQYFPDEKLMQHQTEQQSKQIEHLHTEFGLENQISNITYRMIISDSFENLVQSTKTSKEKLPKSIFQKLLPIAFYYFKCSLPLKEFSQIFADLTNISLTTLDIFHLIFQMSDPVVRGLCIEHYSFINPVPFYYPRLDSHHHVNVKQKFNLHQHVKPSNRFEICKELWFSIQQFNGLVSFGLGWASWNPIGKSHLLDLMFETDFVKGSPQTSPFHLNSIDIQMTKNLFGKRERTTHESTQWAYIDCHACSDTNVIRDICKNLDIALVHVSYSDYEKNYAHLQKDVNIMTVSTKHVYVLVRDCPENKLRLESVSNETNTQKIEYIFIPILIKPDLKYLSRMKDLGYRILHSKIEIPRLIVGSFIEELMNKYSNWNNLDKERDLIEKIKSYCIKPKCKQGAGQFDFDFLSYYPHFVKYMLCFYKVLNEQDQKVISQLNAECKDLATILEGRKVSQIMWDFSDILCKKNSTLILWKLTQELNKLSKQLSADNKTVISLEILWREAILSNKYYVKKANSPDEHGSKFLKILSLQISNHVDKGEPFELIDGDNLRFSSQDIDTLLSPLYKKINCGLIYQKRPPIVISIFGPQSSGKSTLLNYCFGCKFLTSAGRCTKGVYASLSKLSRPINHSDHFLILDTEGLDAIEKAKTVQDTSCINFDRTMVLFCLAVSQAIIINVKGDIGEEMRNLLHICAYSLNKLKVSKVAAPKIFFVLNQQADPEPEKHLYSINILLEKLNNELDLMETEGVKISDLIQVSKENLFVLPSAFNSEPINTQMSKLFDSDIFKLSPTVSFANKCADLRMSIIHQLENIYDTKTPFNTMSQWMEMSGVIWDTIIKYQDIVKYRNTEELKCSILLRRIVGDLMTDKIYRNKKEYQSITEQITHDIKDIKECRTPNAILEDVGEGLDEVFSQYEERAVTAFAEIILSDSLLKRMNYMCDEAKSNMNRLIYMEKKICEDKLKLAIKARLTDIEQSESMLKLQQDIERNADTYFELTIERQKEEFEKIWVGCFTNGNKEEGDEYDEKFESLYSVFMIESKTMENKQRVHSQFRQSIFNMDKVIQKLDSEILSKFCGNTIKGTEQFIYPWRENRTPLKEMTPYLGKGKCQYLHRNSLFYMKDDNDRSETGKNDLKLQCWVPSECRPLVRYCSGYYSHPDIIWNTEKREQILLLASKLKDPDNSSRSIWEKLINDIRLGVEGFIEKDPNISHSTVKEIVNFLCHICKVVNYEINYIEAKLTVVAERTISSFAFALVFKSLLETNMTKQRENALEKETENALNFFLRKVKNQKLARENWDRKERRKGEESIANTFAGKFIAGIWRGIKATFEQSIDEEYFDKEKGELSHKSILFLAIARIKDMLLLTEEPIDEHNFVVQFICNRTQCLKSLFQEKWNLVANILFSRITENMKTKIDRKITIVKNILEEFLRQLKVMCADKHRLEEIGTDSDSSFEVVNQGATEESATNINPESQPTKEESAKTRIIPLKTMVSFLKMYLDPKVSQQDFNQFFNNVFEIDGVKVKKHPITYVLFEKPNNPTQILDGETFKRLLDTNMFGTTEEIFNIEVYLHGFLDALNFYQFKMTETEYENLLEATKEKFEADIINCSRQCPSCGKFCEKESHPNGGKCQIMTGHQMCSMGGNVWNTNEDRTAVLLMCEDYMDYSPVLIPGQNMTWGEFKDKFCNEWDWDLPIEDKYVDLQKENHETMREIWNKFGKEILAYYRNRGTPIKHIPYTSPKKIYESLFSPINYICFILDGTDSIVKGKFGQLQKLLVFFKDTSDMWYFKSMASKFMKDISSEGGTSHFKVIVYHGHNVKNKKCIEMFPNNSEFTTDIKSIETFLKTAKSYGKNENEFAMLDGLAAATTKCEWKSGFGVKNILVHIYTEPTDGDFDVFDAIGQCEHIDCSFDWERDVKYKIKDFKYRRERFVEPSHPEFDANDVALMSPSNPSEFDFSSWDESAPKGEVYINCQTDV